MVTYINPAQHTHGVQIAHVPGSLDSKDYNGENLKNLILKNRYVHNFNIVAEILPIKQL